AVEIQFPYEVPAVRLKEELERLQLPLVLINLPAGDLMQGGDGLACVPARQTEFDQALEEALSYAAMVRPQTVNVLAGRLPAGVAREQALATLITNLRRTAEAFQALGIRVCCEAINPLDMPGFLINTPEDLLGLLDAVGHPNLFAQLDLYHMARQELELPAAIRALVGRIGHVQFADCPGRGAPGSGALDVRGFLINTPEDLLGLLDAARHPNLFAQLDLYLMARQELELPAAVRALVGRIGHVQFADCPGRGAPGSGALDFAAALHALGEAGYDGWLAAEYRPDAAGTEAGLGWLANWRAGL